MRSRPAKAATSMRRVERGRWKLVKSASTARNRYPGEMAWRNRTIDIGRQGHLSRLVEISPQLVALEGQADGELALVARDDLDARAMREDDRARAQGLRGIAKREPVPSAERLGEEQ